MNNKELITLARAARDSAYAPYSHFHVGVALLSSSDRVYTGCNVENAAFTPGICAERVAMGYAVAQGERVFKAIAIVVSSEEFAYPCGVCRQFMAEFGLDIKIVIGAQEEVRETSLRELLPNAFTSFVMAY